MPFPTVDYVRRFHGEVHSYPPPTSKLAAGALIGVIIGYPLGVITFGGAMILATMVSASALVHVYQSRGAVGGRGYAWAAVTLSLLWWGTFGQFVILAMKFGPVPSN